MQAGRRRRLWVIATLLATLAVCTTIALSSSHDLWAAVAILVISLAGFHAVAWLTFDCGSCWRAVDYPWVFATFMTILIALTSIYESQRMAPLVAAQTERRLSYEQLIYSIKSVVTNDCHPKVSRSGMWTPAPEPYEGACDRVEHFLPQIENEAARESIAPTPTTWNAWGLNILIAEEKAVGSWAGLYATAHQYEAISRRTTATIDRVNAVRRSPIANWASSGTLKYWYFVLAFCLGLRLSKVTAELTASVVGSRPTTQTPSASEAPAPPESGSEPVSTPVAENVNAHAAESGA